MNLKEQVTSVESSNKLKVLFQSINKYPPSIFFREWTGAKEDEIETFEELKSEYYLDGVNCYTVAELGELLPGRVERNAKDYMLQCLKHGNWEVKYVAYENGIGHVLDSHEVIQWGEEAEARAKMLIYLLENKLI